MKVVVDGGLVLVCLVCLPAQPTHTPMRACATDLAGLDIERVDDLLVPVPLPAVVDRRRHVAPLCVDDGEQSGLEVDDCGVDGSILMWGMGGRHPIQTLLR